MGDRPASTPVLGRALVLLSATSTRCAGKGRKLSGSALLSSCKATYRSRGCAKIHVSEANDTV